MFHVVLSGPAAGLDVCLQAFTAEGYPCQIDPTRAGFPAEDGNEFIELVAHDPTWLARILEIAGRFGYALRLHGQINPPTPVEPVQL